MLCDSTYHSTLTTAQKCGQSHLGLNRAQPSRTTMPTMRSRKKTRNQFIFFIVRNIFTFTRAKIVHIAHIATPHFETHPCRTAQLGAGPCRPMHPAHHCSRTPGSRGFFGFRRCGTAPPTGRISPLTRLRPPFLPHSIRLGQYGAQHRSAVAPHLVCCAQRAVGFRAAGRRTRY